ncbi:uncharacterized protein LOC123470336 [Daphnia magna]|uniref:uncharacterized protein LOC123470336 n=1 Tax=Daphnia magna TaxID=35525 RepID=UPI001E1BB8AB|nr:uncharacterized protein LOC123470336 [Daphnia magna]
MVKHLKVEELTKAELLIYRQLQKEAFPKTFQDLQEGRLPHHKEKIAALRPVWDARDKLIRITGRVELALRDREIEPAILLPAQHPVVKLIIQDRHVSLKHAGVKTTLSDLRERFLIIKGRQQTKSVWHACVKCQRLSLPPFREIAAPLPINRLKQAKAFEITGVDFAGPLYYKHPTLRKKRKQTDPTSSTDPSLTDGSALEPTVEPPAMEPIEEPPTTEPTEENEENRQLDKSSAKTKGKVKQPKSYACLFTSAVTRAVHLELTKTMSARDFLLAFRRFSARRGSVSIMYSDNAQTFRCVSKHLKVIRSDPAIHDLLAMRKTEWIFSASLAPWWGGFWESMVRTMKDLLRRSNGRACLKYDELEVSLIETDSVVNARPLTYVAEGSDDPLPITPNQFLNNRPSNCTPPEPAKNLMAPDATNLKLLEMDRQRREYVSDICERFVTDYFLQIDKLHCKGGPGRKIRVGEVVIIHDDNTKRLMWTIGVVKELVASRDGLIRSVMVKTPNGNLINRAIQSLHPLELREDQQDDVEIPPTPELELEKKKATPTVAAADPVEQEEPWTTGSVFVATHAIEIVVHVIAMLVTTQLSTIEIIVLVIAMLVTTQLSAIKIIVRVVARPDHDLVPTRVRVHAQLPGFGLAAVC